MKDKIIVIGFSGMLSAGKTTLMKTVAEKLDNSVTLFWDDYDHLVELEFKDPKKWLQDGCDTNKWKTVRFIEDLRSLKTNNAIQHPITNKNIEPAKYVLVEDPTGRTREEMAELIDTLVFIDLPQEISLARAYNRELQNETKWIDKTELVNFLQSFTSRYLDWFHGALLNIEKRLRQDADLIVDGSKSSEELAKMVINKLIQEKKNKI